MSEADGKKRGSKRFLTWSPVASAVVTALATAMIAWATYELATISEAQRKILDQTDQTSRLRDRAFVYFFDPTITPYPPEKPTVWGIGINVENAGNMPARYVSISNRLSIKSAPQGSFPYDHQSSRDKKENKYDHWYRNLQ